MTKKKEKCSKCGYPLNLRVSQLLGKRNYVTVETEDFIFLMTKLGDFLKNEMSYDSTKFHKLELKYDRIKNGIEGLKKSGKKERERCPKCGNFLNLEVGQLIENYSFIIVDTDDFKYIIRILNNKLESVKGSEWTFLEKIKGKYKNVNLKDEEFD